MKRIPRLAAFFLLGLVPIHAGEIAVSPTPTPGPTPLQLIDPALLGFGRPGFSLAVTGSQAMDYDGDRGSLKVFDGRMRLPVWGKDLGNGTFVGASLSYSFTSLKASDLLGLSQQNLQTFELKFTVAHLPTKNEGWMGLLIVSPGLASDLQKIKSDDYSFTAIAVLGWQFSDRFTLAAAGYYSHTIGEDTAIPGIGIIWRPTDTFIVQLTPPIGAIGWTPTPDWTFSLAAYPGGGNWAVDRQGRDQKIEAIALSIWRVGLGVERHFGKNWSVTAQVGTNLGGSLELRTEGQRVIEQRDLKPSAFGLLGVSWSF